MFPESLLELARQGNPAARNTLLSGLRPLVRAIVRKRGAREDEASDLANEALLKIHQALSGFRGGPRELRAWSRVIAEHLWVDLLRKEKGKPPPAPLPGDVVDPCVQEAEASVLAEEQTGLLMAALEQLPPERRLVLEMRFLGGQRCADVARQLGRTEGWVRITSMRAIEELRRFYRGPI